MDETKKPKRVTRSRQSVVDESNENAVAAPKKESRSKKPKVVSENGSDGEHQHVGDFDDSASSKSSSSTSSSVRSCKVILERENFDEILKPSVDDDDNDRAIAHKTRARTSSHLTEENVAAHVNPARRALRSTSVASDGTGSTKSRTTRSSRVAASQNTPKKDSNASRPATPSRRSSRLVSENDKAVDSPAKPTPSKRNLRSNSIASVDEVSPQPVTRTRSSSRLAESQGTPNTLKTKVTKIKTEPTTPRRASTRINKSSILTDIIDEESSDDDKSKKDPHHDKKKVMKTVDEEEKTVTAAEAVEIEPDNSLQMQHDNSKVSIVVQQNSSATEKSPTVSSTVNDEVVKLENIEPIDNDALTVPQTEPTVSIVVTGPAEATENDTPIEQMADTPTVEPAEPMETSLIEHIEHAEASTEKDMQIVDDSDAHGNTTLKTTTAIFNEETASPQPDSSKKQQQQQQKTPVIIEEVKVEIEKPTNTDEILKSTNIDETLTEILKTYSPKPKSRPSEAFKAMNVSALVDDEKMMAENASSPAPAQAPAPVSPSKHLKVSSKRLSLNNTIQSTGFDQMEVTALAADFVADEKQSDDLSPQKEAAEVSTKDLANENVNSPRRAVRLSIPLLPWEKTPSIMGLESPQAQTSKIATPKVDTPIVAASKALTPKFAIFESHPSPLKTPIAVQTIKPTSLITPSFNTGFDCSFDNIADNLTPGQSDSNINERIDEILANMTTTSIEPTTNDSNSDEVPESCVATEDKTNEKSIHSDQHDVSVVDKSQPELDETTLQTEVVQRELSASVAKTVRKSVQIMTPKNEKIHSADKRVDTPYPYPTGGILETANSPSELDDGKKANDDERERQQKLAESWSKPVRQISLTYDSPKPIDALGIDKNDKTEDEQPKKSVPARNNWKVGLVDSESDSDSIVQDSAEESIGDEEQSDDNDFIDGEAEEVENYDSGDSMDESERREAEENEIPENGEDLGSEDSEDEDLNQDYDSQDSFLVSDSEVIQNTLSSSGEEDNEPIVKSADKRRRSRILEESSTDDSTNIESSIDADSSSNDVVSISMQVESVVVLGGNNAVEEKIVEGKTFATTYFIPKNDDQQTETHTEKSAEEEVMKNIEQPETEENEHGQTSVASKMESDKIESDLTENPNSTETVTVPQNVAHSTNTNEVTEIAPESQKSASDVDSKDKELAKQKILTKKQRASLSGIHALSKASSNIGKKANRMSLGDLNPNHPHLRGAVFDSKPLAKSKSISSKTKLVEQDDTDSTTAPFTELIDADERESNANASSSSIENMSPNHSKAAPLNISSQEENNNRKNSAKKSKAVATIRSDEVIPTVSETEHVTTTEMNDSAKKKKARSKRKFEEVDIGEDDQMMQPESRKLLKIIETASGAFLEEPMTPEKKNKHAFQVTPLTPVNRNFRVHNLKVKRKSIYVAEDDPIIDEILPKPKWKINSQFEVVQPRKRARKLEVGSTEVVLTSLETKKKSKPTIPDDVRQFRHQHMYRAGIPREDKRAQLRQLYKKRANFH